MALYVQLVLYLHHHRVGGSFGFITEPRTVGEHLSSGYVPLYLVNKPCCRLTITVARQVPLRIIRTSPDWRRNKYIFTFRTQILEQKLQQHALPLHLYQVSIDVVDQSTNWDVSASALRYPLLVLIRCVDLLQDLLGWWCKLSHRQCSVQVDVSWVWSYSIVFNDCFNSIFVTFEIDQTVRRLCPPPWWRTVIRPLQPWPAFVF